VDDVTVESGAMNSHVAMNTRVSDTSEAVIQFAPATRNTVPDEADLLDRAGQTILGLLHQAADAADGNSKRALDIAQKLSLELKTAEDRIKDLEADVSHHQDRAERAEKWLYQISVEIEEIFFAAADNHRTDASPRKTSPRDYAPRNNQRWARS
jgi:hypothetical protein